MRRHFIAGCCALLLALPPVFAAEQRFDLDTPALAAAPAATAATAMRDLARRILPVYAEPDPLRYLAQLSMLQAAAGDYAAALDSRRLLRDRQRDAGVAPTELAALFDLYTQARAEAAAGATPFAQAFTPAFRERTATLADRDAYALASWLRTPPATFEQVLRRMLEELRGEPSVELPQALALVDTWLALEARRSFGAWTETLIAEDSRRRYQSQEQLRVPGADGATLRARIVRPRHHEGRLPALLEFRIDSVAGEAEASAAHGYVGVVAYVRGQRAPGMPAGRGAIQPFEHDGADARAVIAWIARQPWSDGRVGMIGERYSGFAAWAAAKRAPPALKAIATANAMAPGIDFPTQGGVFHNDAYRWLAQPRGSRDGARWQGLDERWYRSGRAYRELDLVARNPEPVFQRWLSHPSYDRYWQKFIPLRDQFAGIALPALSITGYYAEHAAGALYYFNEHLRYRPQAAHTLLIGPYDDDALQRVRPAPLLRGYALDSAALVDLRELRYQWLDSVFRNAAKPALLQDRLNYQPMGTGRWRHAASPAAVASERLRFYLQPAAGGAALRLSPQPPAAATVIQQSLQLAGRDDADTPPPPAILGRAADAPHALRFVSEPLTQATEFAGVFDGVLDFTVNKMDMDLNLALYEQLASGQYLLLCAPTELRASYAGDRAQRRLLRAGMRQQLRFSSARFCARQLQAGSRLLLLLGINKRADRQINHGSGKAVSDETVADAGAALKIQWHGGSYLELPVAAR